MTPSEFHDRLRAYCGRFAASVTSSGRTVTHNRIVGGVERSAHLFWLAADVVYDHTLEAVATLEERAEIARRLGLKLIHENDHDHVQPLDWRAG